MTEMILDHPDILRVLFHPRRDYGLAASEGQQVTVAVEPEVSLGGRLYVAALDAPLIMYYHGNGEIAADYDDIANLYKSIGVTLLVMDYRGYGASTGTPTASNLLSDAHVVFQALAGILARNSLNPARTYLMGRSLGSVPTIETAVQSGAQLDGIIIESGFADTFGLLQRLGVQVRGAVEAEHGFHNGAKMEQVTTRTLVLHGTSDVLIPAADGQELHDRCAAADKQLILIPGAGHNDIMLVGMQEYFMAIQSFVYPE